MLDPKTEDFQAVLIKTWGSSSSAVSSLLWFGILDTLPETKIKFEKLGPNCPKKGKGPCVFQPYQPSIFRCEPTSFQKDTPSANRSIVI